MKKTVIKLKSNGRRSSETADGLHQELYARHQKIFPREVHGWFATARNSGITVLLGLFYILPWIDWKGRQAVLFDLPARKFYIFNLTYWPQDFFYMAMLLIICALSLFFFTAIAGRLWCGFACPQTAWTVMFMWVERLIEGDRQEQLRLQRSPMNRRKVLLRSAKHTVWIVLSLWTGFTFVAYFTEHFELLSHIYNWQLGPWEAFWIFFYGFATYGNAGWMREQVCLYMCPYARFQSAMFDRDTLIVSYDPGRGEPRGSRRKSVDPASEGLGDCVNCGLCVQVCPTGIDIRDGLQYQCISCAACVDACDSIMENMSYPKGLVRFTTENSLEGKKTQVLRPRILVYGGFLLFLTMALVYSMVTRLPISLDVIRDRNALYRETRDGLVENTYTLKIINKDESTHVYRLAVTGVEGMSLLIDVPEIRVAGGEISELAVRLRADPVDLKVVSTKVIFELQAMDNRRLFITRDAKFIGPM